MEIVMPEMQNHLAKDIEMSNKTRKRYSRIDAWQRLTDAVNLVDLYLLECESLPQKYRDRAVTVRGKLDRLRRDLLAWPVTERERYTACARCAAEKGA